MSHSTSATESRLSHDASRLFRRFTELSALEQLQIYETTGEYLRARNVAVRPDSQLERQGGTAQAIRAVAEHLGLDDPTTLHKDAFNSAPEDIRAGWTAAQAIKAHGTWRAAREVAAGDKPIPTARQRTVGDARSTPKLRVDDHIAAVRRWLETDPPSIRTTDYNDWKREWNGTRPDGTLPLPGYAAIRVKLQMPWPLILQIAKREITLAQARKLPNKLRRNTGGTGLFISSSDIAGFTGKPETEVWQLVQGDDFPVCVLVINDRRYWLRADVQAYLKGNQFPKRKLHELNDEYVGTRGAAAILGIRPSTVHRLKGGMPDPVYRGGSQIWTRASVEDWKDKRLRENAGTGRWRRAPKG